MNILSDIQTALASLGIPIETGVLKSKAADAYIVVVPLTDTFKLHADNLPEADVQEARMSLFTKGPYTELKDRLISLLLRNDFTITFRQYNGYETDTGWHHYVVDAAKPYLYELEE